MTRVTSNQAPGTGVFRHKVTGTGAAAMRLLRRIAAFFPVLFLAAACTSEWATDYGEPLDRSVTGNWRITRVSVSVPDTLTVSEENRFAPNADIVWHGDLPGDRRAQVRTIVSQAARKATSGLNGSQNAELVIAVTKFHSVTPITMARAPEAVHDITMTAQVRDRQSGAALTPPTLIRADLPALVREDALQAEQFGIPQKEQISRHITAVFKGWLGIGPDVRNTFVSVGR